MNIEDLQQILQLVRDHDLVELELELEQQGVKLRVRKDSVHAPMAPVPHAAQPIVLAATPVVAAPALAPPSVTSPSGGENDALADAVELAVVKSPIVGTFYRSPSPGAPAFVEVGTTVKKGQVLCIIEAMKLMNEIECEYDGDIVQVYVETGQPVQYGERLFAIRAR